MNDLRATECAGEAPALHSDETGWISHAQLAERADTAVATLPERSLFALEFEPNAACVATYLGALRHGHVALLLDGSLPLDMKQRLYGTFGITRVFADRLWLTTGDQSSDGPPLHPDLALLMSTSGSTGSPKLVRLSLQNLNSNADSIVRYMGLSADDRAISSLPLHYSYGLSVLNSHLLAGGSMVLGSEAVTTKAFWDRFGQHGVTGLTGVPATWRMLRRMRFERMKLPHLKLMTQAGGRLDPDEVRWLAKVSADQQRRLFIMYGQTEATARISYLPPHLALTKAGSVGVAIPGGSLRLEQQDGTPVWAPAEEGEIVYQGPNVMMGYAQEQPDLAMGRSIDELRTGDLGYRDADGLYWITGRLKRFIKIFGNRIALDEVEQYVRSLGLDAAVTGRDDCLMVGVVGHAEEATSLREALASYYRVHASAIMVRTVDALPRNSAGKLLHAELLALLSEPTAGAAQ